MTAPVPHWLPAAPDSAAIRGAFLADERLTVSRLAEHAAVDATTGAAIAAQARQWVEGVRAEQRASAGVESFLHQYDLSTQEGVLLMCVAEALLRIPDADTADLLIRDKLARGDWEKHLGASESLLVNASTWGLMLTGRLTRIEQENARDPKAWYERIVSRAGEPVVRVALRQAMKVMAEQFVMGRTIAEALARSRQGESARYRHSYDMLGEAALTAAELVQVAFNVADCRFNLGEYSTALKLYDGLAELAHAGPSLSWASACCRAPASPGSGRAA